MAQGSTGWVVGRYLWNGAIIALGIVIIVLGAMQVTKNPKVDPQFIVFGAMTIAEGLYFMIRRIPRFTGGGEEERSGTAEAIDTILIIVIFLIGVGVAIAVGMA